MTEAGFFEKVQNQHLVAAAAAANRVRWVVEFLPQGYKISLILDLFVSFGRIGGLWSF